MTRTGRSWSRWSLGATSLVVLIGIPVVVWAYDVPKWDSGLNKRRIIGGVVNGVPTWTNIIDSDSENRSYRIGIENESSYGGSFPGPAGFSYTPGSSFEDFDWTPVIFWWSIDPTDGAKVANLKINQHDYYEPGFSGKRMYTWNAFQDPNNHRLPVNPSRARESVWVKYSNWTPGDSNTRLFLTNAFRGGQSQYVVEVHIHESNGADAFPNDPLIVQHLVYLNGNGVWVNYTQVNGQVLGIPALSTGVWTQVYINWSNVLNQLNQRTFEGAPMVPDFASQPDSFFPGYRTYDIAHETGSTAPSGNGAPISDLKIKKWSIVETY